MAHNLTKFVDPPQKITTISPIQSNQVINLTTLGQPTRIFNVPYTPDIIYRLRGYYVAGATFEVWTGSTKNTPPPTGHTLVDVVVEGVL
jgi:hypothetical protein